MKEEAPMHTNTDKPILRMLEVAAALVMIAAGLNLLVMQTLGSFDAAAVILALFVGFWAFVLGTVLLLVFKLVALPEENSYLRDHFVVWRRPGSSDLAVHVENVTSRS
jgi:energy-converting hydrogenase Eha subunit A